MKFVLTSIISLSGILALGWLEKGTEFVSTEAVFNESYNVIERDVLYVIEGPTGSEYYVEAIMLFNSEGDSSQFGFWLTETDHRGYDFWILERKLVNGKMIETWKARSTKTGKSQFIGSNPTALDREWLAKFRATAWAHEPIVKTDRMRLLWKGNELPIESTEFYSLEQKIDILSKLPEEYEGRNRAGQPIQLIQVKQIAKSADLWVPVRLSIHDLEADRVIKIKIRNTRKLQLNSVIDFSNIVDRSDERYSEPEKQSRSLLDHIESLSVL